MTRYVLLRAGQRDLDEIWLYTLDRWGVEQAKTYLQALRDAASSIAADPKRGRACDDIRSGYFKYAAGSHVIFYRLQRGTVQIVRILHRRMDFDRHL